MGDKVIQNKIYQTANIFGDEECYSKKLWNSIFDKYQDQEGPYDYSIDELELHLEVDPEIISKPSHKSLSASSFSLSGDDTNPNLKTSLSSESESEFYLRNATQSLSNSDNNISDKSPSTQLELNIEKISPDKINSSNLSLLSRFRKMPKMSTVVNSTKNQQDCLNLDPTSPLKLCLKQEPRIPFAPLHPPQRLRRLNVLNQDEVPPEVEHTISNVFGDFINTDMLPVLRCILTFNNYRHQGERYNRIISPYIEKSISMPLRLKNVNYTLKITPIKHLTTSQPIKSNLSPSQLMLHRRAKSTSNRSTITSFHSTNKYIQPKRSNDNCPIKLLETSHTKDENISREISLSVRPTVNRFKNSDVRNSTFIPIKLLETSADKDILLRERGENTPIRISPLKCNIRLLDTTLPTVKPDKLASGSKSNCLNLESRPFELFPLSNSTPTKRTFSKMNDVKLSKRVRLDYDNYKI